jgi:tRNA/rRNA methyltransferase
MAGTNKQIEATPALKPPVVVLVHPQLGENIGMCARAMLNCAVTELRLVKPRDGWPNISAITSASGATRVVEEAKIFATTEEAIADLDFVFATTARVRGMVKDMYTPDAAAKALHEKSAGGGRCGILFGPERAGLENDDVARANAVLHIPLNPGFSSLNLAQAVLLACHAWLSADNPFKDGEIVAALGATEPAKKEEIETLMLHLEDALAGSGFFRSPDQRPSLMLNIRNFFFRSAPTQQDVRTLHGIFVSLTGKKSWK